jgi:glycosyltransferase involved in cell wall biosynthesis
LTVNYEKLPDISVVIPVRNEAANIPELVARLDQVLRTDMQLGYEVIFVTDINTDDTVGAIRRAAHADRRVKAIKLSNAFGHHVAVVAGLRASVGRAVVIMDGDLQDYPEDIPKLCAAMQRGYDIVYGEKERKDDSGIRNLLSRGFLKILSFLSDQRLDYNTCMFRIISRRVVTQLLRFKEHDPSLTMIMSLIGFPTKKILVTSGTRQRGETKFSYVRQMNLALSFLVSFSTKPLRVISVTGLIISCLSLLLFVEVLFERLVLHRGVPGWATVVAAISFLSGVQLLSLGVIAEYVARIFKETKARPLFIVEETIGDLATAEECGHLDPSLEIAEVELADGRPGRPGKSSHQRGFSDDQSNRF